MLQINILYKFVYYINTSEIPSELSRKNFISSHVKLTCYLHTWRDHHCYGYIIHRAFESKLIWYFMFNSISHSFAALTHEISSWPLEDKIHIHAQACNILYILHICLEVNVAHIFTSELLPCSNITFISDDSILLSLNFCLTNVLKINVSYLTNSVFSKSSCCFNCINFFFFFVCLDFTLKKLV